MAQEIDRFTLLTNIEWITIDGIRTHSHALLLSDDFIMDRRLEVRAFGTESAWPVFDFHVKSLEHELVDATPQMYIDDERFHQDGHRIYTGYDLILKEGRTLKLAASNSRFPIDVQTFEGPSRTSLITEVWNVLWDKVERYWKHPAMPHLNFAPPGTAVDILRLVRG